MTTSSSALTVAHWRDEYLTGDARIDQEHKMLFDMVNDLHAAMHTSASPARLRAMIQTMAEHTTEHFQHEEALMQRHHYPGCGRHKQVHDNLLEKVSRLLTQFDQAEPVISDKLTEFLTAWLAHHIRGEDQKLIEFLRSRND